MPPDQLRFGLNMSSSARVVAHYAVRHPTAHAGFESYETSATQFQSTMKAALFNLGTLETLTRPMPDVEHVHPLAPEDHVRVGFDIEEVL